MAPKFVEVVAAGWDTAAIPVAAGGEFVVHPDVVREIGRGNIDHGHKILAGIRCIPPQWPKVFASVPKEDVPNPEV